MGAFNKKKQVDIDLQAISTLIDEGATINGNLHTKSFARIDGTVVGNVNIDEGLILGEKGNIKGDVATKEMVIFGTVNGNINVQTLQIKSTGKIVGEIKTVTVSIEPGAVYNGKITMGHEADKT